MPNWTSNTIRVEGCEAAMREFLKFVSGDEGPFDFNRIVPMPELLRHIGKGLKTFDGEGHSTWYIIDPGLPYTDPAWPQNERPFTPEEKAALADIGFESWYEWSIEHWGTKWNACRASIEEFPVEDGVCEIRFDTAWAAPFPIFRKVAAMFPQLAFEFTWSDEDEPDLSHTLRIHIGEAPGDEAA